MNFEKFPSVEQFRSVVRRVTDHANLPTLALTLTLTFTGTVKLHGTNAGIRVNFTDEEYWAQSRGRDLSMVDDNAGFCAFTWLNVYEILDLRKELMWAMQSVGYYNMDNYSGAVFYGEWCGKGIQKGVAINALERMFVIFGIKLLRCDGRYEWLPDRLVRDVVSYDEDARIFNIFTFGSWKITIDFNRPELSQNNLIAYTEEVEKCCPVGKYFGVEGVGEGIVWRCITEPYNTDEYMFKVKGEKHSESRVKRLASMDIEKVNSIAEFADKVVTENRLQHGLEYLKENGLGLTMQHTGVFLKWLVEDCLKEETDTIEASGLTAKEVGKACGLKARVWYFQAIEER